MKTESTDPKLATHIALRAHHDKRDALDTLLGSAGALVRRTEPQTLQWLAVKSDADGSSLIIDLFADEQGRAAHFKGSVADALAEAAPTLVEGGFENGVLANARHSSVLASMVRDNGAQSSCATAIEITAKPGQAHALAALLEKGANVVEQTEPLTLLWYALKLDESRFMIFDAFASAQGRTEHFAGQVASILKTQAEALIEGGWEQGVVANARHFTVLSTNL